MILEILEDLKKGDNPLGELCSDILRDDTFPKDVTHCNKQISYLYRKAESNPHIKESVDKLVEIVCIRLEHFSFSYREKDIENSILKRIIVPKEMSRIIMNKFISGEKVSTSEIDGFVWDELKKWNITRVGTKFVNKKGKIFMICGACKFTPSGTCFLASAEYGWSYTGVTVKVENCRDITDKELYELMGGHQDKFEKLIQL